MTLGALIDVGVDPQAIRDGIASLGLPVELQIDKVRKGGFAATHVRVTAPHEHKHRHLHHIEEILNRGKLSDSQRDLALRIFRRLAEAEAAVHGITIQKVHFHEVGALDSIADIAGAAIGLDLLGVDQFTCTSVPTGGGTVQCEHGMMPIPAPATAELLKGVPLRPCAIQSELTTPTGAAILTTIVKEWVDQPAMTIERIGCGAGTRDLKEQPNVLRIFVGQASSLPIPSPLGGEGPGVRGDTDQVWMLETNLDDLPAEVIGYCYDLLLNAGALDVFTTPIFMKKNRPGVLLSVLAPAAVLPAVEEILFRETTTFGIRRYPVQRHKLHRRECYVETRWGPIQGKLGWLNGHTPEFSPEYEDCARVARAKGIALREVFQEAERIYRETAKAGV